MRIENRKKYIAVLMTILCIIMLFPQRISAVEEDSQRETVRVGFFEMNGYHMQDEDGNRSGYGYDTLRLMARYWNVDYEYIGYDKSWSEMQKMLEDGEVDLVTSARKTPEREEIFDYSRPIGSNECMVTIRKNNHAIIAQDYSTYNGMRVGMLNGNAINKDFEEFSKEKEFTYTPVYFDKVSDMESALQSDGVDALVSSSLRVAKNETAIEKFNSSSIYIIVKKGNTELLNKINYAIDQVSAAEGDWENDLYNRYYSSADERNLEFTYAERAIIAQYSSADNPLMILCDPTRKPYSYIEDGEMKGILPDYFRKLADYCGISYKFILCDSREEYVSYGTNGKQADLTIDARFPDDNLPESKDYGVTAPYITIKSAKVYRKDFNGEIKTVATVEQGEADSIEDIYAPDAKKIIYPSREEAMEAVKAGDADVAFVYYYTAQEFVNNDSSGNMRYSLVDQPSFQYRIALAPGVNHALAGVLTKGIYALPDRTIADIASGYTAYKASDMTLKMLVQLHPRALLILTGVMLLLVIIVGVQWLKLRGKNNELKVSFDKINRDKHVLDRLCTDYTAVYYVELNSREFETLKIMRSSNADEVMRKAEKGIKDFDEYTQYYAQHYLTEEDKTEFLKWISCANLKAELQHTDRVAYNYKSVPGTYGKQFFSVQVINIYEDAQKMYVLMGFRYIDEIIEKEKEIQKRLQDALDELQMNNEIISAISKNYCYIAHIDLQKDFFEEISNDEEMHWLTGNSGCASEKLRQDCEMQVAPEYRAYLYPFLDTSTLKERLKNEEYVSTEYRVRDGSWHRLRFIVKKRDEAGNVTHVLYTVREISDLKRREEDLLFAADAAKRESEMKTRFLATMSHDIRTPLNGIIGLVNLAEQHADDMKMLKEIRDKMMKSLKYLVSLVNDVLDMNKIQSGDFKSEEIIFDSVDMMRKILRIYDQKAVEKGIRLEVDWEKCSVKYPVLVGNPVYFGRILASIIDNAIKFSPSDSTITVWGREEILEDDQAVLTIWCKDQGIGMSEEFIEHAFDMFAQEKESSRSQYEGTGLGLTIAKALVDKMGGTIEFQSKQGVGTTAIIKIPFKLGQQDISSKTTNYDNVSVEGMRVLVVDDNELNVEIAKCMLENSGLEVTCAADGQEAVEIFEKSEPGYYGAIFMDIMMPRMDGLEATKTIRNTKRSDAWSIPIIAVSANAFVEDILNSKQAGMNAHLAKPLDVNKLIDTLKNCLAENSELKLREDL